MSRRFISVEEAFREWRKDPEYVTAYEALEEEFALASALIKARADAAYDQPRSGWPRRWARRRRRWRGWRVGRRCPPPGPWRASQKRPALGSGSASSR